MPSTTAMEMDCSACAEQTSSMRPSKSLSGKLVFKKLTFFILHKIIQIKYLILKTSI